MRRIDGVWQPDEVAAGMVVRYANGQVYDISRQSEGNGLIEFSRASRIRFHTDASVGNGRQVIGLKRRLGDIVIGNTISGVAVINAKVVGVCDAHTVVVALPNDPREWLVDLDRQPLQLEAIPVASGPATVDGISRYHTAKWPAEIGSAFANRSYAMIDDLKAIGVVPASAMPDVLRAMAGAAHRPFSLAARNPAAVVLETLCYDVPASCIWAHEDRDAITVYVDVPDSKVSGKALRGAAVVANAARPMDSVPVRVERSQMHALRALAKAAEAYLKSPQGQRHIAEWLIRRYERRYPAFATARRAAVMAHMETAVRFADSVVPGMLIALREYEDLRGIGREPSPQAVARGLETVNERILAIYERYRGLP